MKLASRGQVTIPAELRAKHGLTPGDELDVVEDGDALRIVRRNPARSRGARTVHRMRGRATTNRTTDDLMEPFRGD